MSTGNAGVDPDDVLRANTRRLSDAYRERLGAGYEDPREAARRFHAEASRSGPAGAAARMRERPGDFGALLGGGRAAAAEAAELGARAYRSRLAETDPRLAPDVLERALVDALPDALARERALATWTELARAYPPEDARRTFEQRFPEVLAGEDGSLAASIARLAAARDRLRERAGLVPAPAEPRRPPLPRSLADAQDAPGEEWVRGTAVAAAERMRGKLAEAYQDPLVAEARLHRAVNTDGFVPLDILRRRPEALGPLRDDGPGGRARAEEAAMAAGSYAAIAYEYHGVRGGEPVERLHAEAVLAATRHSARDPERAMEGIQEAIQRRGPELRAHLDAERVRRTAGRERDPRERAGTEPAPPGREERDPAEPPPRRAPDGRDAPPAAPGTAGGGEIDEAVRSLTEVAEARALTEGLPALRAERRQAQEVLAALAEADASLRRAHRDLRTVAAERYDDPDVAIRRWREAVAAEGVERARERLARDPDLLGRRSADAGSPLRRAVQAAARALRPPPSGSGPDGGGAEHRLAELAGRFAAAERKATEPVEWTAPDGTRVRGRRPVRTAAENIVAGSEARIAAAEARLEALGGVSGAEERAVRRLERLSPEQRAAALERFERTGGPSAGRITMDLSRLLNETLRTTRTLAEGPGGP